jgi:hypothetical protein
VYPLSPHRTVPDHIKKPDYADTGIPLSEQNIRSSSVIEVLPKEDIDVLRKVCKVMSTLSGILIKKQGADNRHQYNRNTV